LKLRYKLSREALITATNLDGLGVIEIGGKEATREMHLCEVNPAFVNHLRTLGNAGAMKTKMKTTAPHLLLLPPLLLSVPQWRTLRKIISGEWLDLIGTASTFTSCTATDTF
jgi:hypothetical protein